MTRSSWSRQWALVHEHALDSVITVATLERLGVDRTTAYRRCRHPGPWRWLLPGVLLLTAGPATDRQRNRAALLFGGPTAMITGHTATRLHGFRNAPPSTTVPLLVPDNRQRRSAGFAVVERTTRLPDAVIIAGLPCAPIPRAALDAVRRLRDPRQVQALLAEAVQRGGCTPRELRRELDAGSQRGSALPRAALGAVAAGARSVAEADALQLWRRAGLPEAYWNVQLVTAAGQPIATPDAWLPSVGLAWEIDSYDYHFERVDYARTLDRNARYTAHEVSFLQTIPSRLTRDADAVLQELRDAYPENSW
ncbi:MAG: hypothetical protein M3R63_16875 [Actinomycetota bacterium]|nr:hypothetical protein [Actinomycetota bacterium]